MPSFGAFVLAYLILRLTVWRALREARRRAKASISGAASL